MAAIVWLDAPLSTVKGTVSLKEYTIIFSTSVFRYPKVFPVVLGNEEQLAGTRWVGIFFFRIISSSLGMLEKRPPRRIELIS